MEINDDELIDVTPPWLNNIEPIKEGESLTLGDGMERAIKAEYEYYKKNNIKNCKNCRYCFVEKMCLYYWKDMLEEGACDKHEYRYSFPSD